jgi:hypothetical protein
MAVKLSLSRTEGEWECGAKELTGKKWQYTGENCAARNFVIYILPTQAHYQDDRIEDEEEKGGHVEGMGNIISVYKTWIGEPERKRPLRIFIRRW